jgi:hypothetical protein
MTAKLLSAWGYQGDAMALPVVDVETATVYYVEKMGFTIVDRGDEPVRHVVLERDGIRMAINENGGDPSQDGCAFRTDNLAALRVEFESDGLEKLGEVKNETHDDGTYKVFFVVAPDGLCF